MNIMFLDEFKQKIQKKSLSAFSRTQRMKTFNENLHYQSNLELNFIDYCQNNNIKIYDGPSIRYYWNNSEHVYHVDLETDKYIIEIKASHGWYKKDLKSGKIEAKNTAAKKYALSINKEFLFLLDGNYEI